MAHSFPIHATCVVSNSQLSCKSSISRVYFTHKNWFIQNLVKGYQNVDESISLTA